MTIELHVFEYGTKVGVLLPEAMLDDTPALAALVRDMVRRVRGEAVSPVEAGRAASPEVGGMRL